MNFDIKDVKSWTNRQDVKVGDKGYFTHSINWLKDDFELNVNTIACIRDDFGNCFVSEKSFNEGNSFPFFVPLKAVKEDKPKEKKYRPFSSLWEFYKFLSFDANYISEEHFCKRMLLGMPFTYRKKKASRFARTKVINQIAFDLNNICSPQIEGNSLELWFSHYEIMNDKGEWQPFGVEIESD